MTNRENEAMNKDCLSENTPDISKDRNNSLNKINNVNVNVKEVNVCDEPVNDEFEDLFDLSDDGYTNSEYMANQMLYTVQDSIYRGKDIQLTTNGIIERIKDTPTLFEVITGKCKPYFDFDYKYDTKQQQVADLKHRLIQSCNYVETLLGTNEYAVYTANGKKDKRWINSFHIIAEGEFESGYSLKQTILESSIVKPDGLDLSVYTSRGKRQLFRLPYCSKAKQNRPMVLTTIENDELVYHKEPTMDNIEKGLISLEPLVLPTESIETKNNKICDMMMNIFKNSGVSDRINHVYDSFRDEKTSFVVNLKRTGAGKCPCCKVVHTNHYEGASCIRMFHDSKLIVLQCDHAIGKGSSIPLTRKTKRKRQTIQNSYQVNNHTTQYCSDIPNIIEEDAKSLVVKSQMGTGKTRYIKRKIQQILHNNPDARILLISGRRSLAEKYKADYADMGFVCYLYTKDNIMDGGRYICQADSLWRCGSNCVFDLVVLDEWDLIVRNFNSSTFLNNPKGSSNFRMFQQTMGYSKQVIALSATLRVSDIKIMEDMRKITPKVIVNNYIPRKFKIQFTDKDQQYKLMLDDVLAGRKICVAVNRSHEYIQTLKQWFLSHKPDLKIADITAQTTLRPEISQMVKDPENTWGDVDVLIYSPTIQSGVSYDQRNVFYRIYGIFSNITNSSTDAAQMLRRIRHPINDRMPILFEWSNNFDNCIDRNVLIYRLAQIEQRDVDSSFITYDDSQCYGDLSKTKVIENSFIKLWLANKIESNLDSMCWKKNFITIMKDSGNTIEECNIAVKKKVTKELKQCKEVVQEIKANVLAVTPLITEPEFQNIMAKSKGYFKKSDKDGKKYDNTPLTEQNLNESSKFILHQQFKIENNITDPSWYKTYNDSKLKTWYRNLAPFIRNQTIKASLAEILEMDEKIRNYSKHKTTEDGEEVRDELERQIIVLGVHENDRFRYEVDKLLAKFIMGLGFDQLDSKQQIPADEIKNRIFEMKESIDIKRAGILLNKDKRKMESITEAEDKNYVKVALQWWNGSLMSRYGIKIKKVSRRGGYRIVNESLDKNLFINPRLGNIGVFDDTPILGKVIDKKQEVVDEYHDAEEEELNLRDIVVGIQRAPINPLYTMDGEESDYDE